MTKCDNEQAVTYFAPAGRVRKQDLHVMEDVLRTAPLFQATIDAVPEIVLILNACRQVLGCNKAACAMLDSTPEQIIGKRPGELMGCVHVESGPDGCGTAHHCKACGAVNAVLESQRNHGQVSRECRISLKSTTNGGALDLQVTATPFDTNGEHYTIAFMKDISRHKRLEILNRMFFHDVLNTAGSIGGFAEMLAVRSIGEGKTDDDLARLHTLTGQLTQEIQGQRDLMLAESGQLTVNSKSIKTGSFLQDLRAMCAAHEVAAGRNIELDEIWDGTIVTDPTLLTRVLGNMVKNALEATPRGGMVTVQCMDQGDSVTFGVKNFSVIPEQVQLQIFQRSFSTKAKTGRGLGTHSMKLIGEGYLGGQVAFTSSPSEGTLFTLKLSKRRAAVSADHGNGVANRPRGDLHGHVLLAEDGPDNQRLISFILTKAGLDVELAENGLVACEKAWGSKRAGTPYDLILMDVQMPELDGLDATRQLRQHNWTGPIVALTALATQEDQRRCREAGCNECIVKPVGREVLVAAVAKQLGQTVV